MQQLGAIRQLETWSTTDIFGGLLLLTLAILLISYLIRRSGRA